ncbi:MarR family winged helix-turn-helix transcriptional regulator [Cellulomonas sp. P22]|uniref:MarR family winged helix-turn-helix transcriptional regulator n=1 Tax=Cellulomonas sp. P22 TaxID=3373189 RepID=UPI0037B34960
MNETVDSPPTPDADALARFLCFDLYAASRAITGVYRHLLDPLGLTYPQYLVLVVLWQRESATVREVIEALQLDYGTVSPLLKRLEARGLVERRRRPEDERSVDVTLTDAGRALQHEAAGFAQVVTAALGLDEQDSEQFRRMLGRVRTSAASEARRLSGASSEPVAGSPASTRDD